MKSFILSCILLFPLYYSQEYYFDYKCYNVETQIKGRYKGNKRTNIIYFNSGNKDLMAYDYYFSKQPLRSFFLYNYETNNLFSYSINHKSEFSSLNLINSFQIKIYQDEIKIERVDVEEVSENILVIKGFPSQKSKKSKLELKVVLEESDFPIPGNKIYGSFPKHSQKNL
ncbi:hypothetical protein [Chryseobacterium indoltheticum]|uniref:hypothetical protein n=1 Tax=Chryseobacterium indoltheticum TaxID=254 RepID=UPI003F4942ED